MQRRKRYSYILLELLIAISLLSLFLAPLLSSPFSYLRKQKKEIISIYLRLEAEKQLAFLEEKLRTQSISWKQILESQTKEVSLEVLPFKLSTVSYEAELVLSHGSFQTKKEDVFASVKGTVRIYRKSLKREKQYQSTAHFFVLKTKKNAEKGG